MSPNHAQKITLLLQKPHTKKKEGVVKNGIWNENDRYKTGKKKHSRSCFFYPSVMVGLRKREWEINKIHVKKSLSFVSESIKDEYLHVILFLFFYIYLILVWQSRD